jgi:thiamine monophosphate synthase
MFQFSTNESSETPIIRQVQAALDGGCQWIRLTGNHTAESVNQLIPLCQQADAILVLDDNAEVVEQLRIHGLHLTGWTRGELIAIREKLGPHAIIGVTCPEPALIEQLAGLDIDYMVIPAPAKADIPAYFVPFIEKLTTIKSEIHPVAAGNIPVSLRQAVLATGIEGIEINESWNL